MNGSLKKLLNGNNEFIYPITVSEAVYTDPETSLKSKLADLDARIGVPNSYVIELNKWGISSDGTNSANTTKGINDAITWAASKGYNHIVLPGGTYSVKLDSDSVAIYMRDGMHLQMAKDCVIQLDANSSPGYRVIHAKGIKHAAISGGKIVGDKKSHIYEIYVKFVRGGVNPDGTLNSNPQFIRSEVIDRYNNPGLLSNFRLWSIDGVTTKKYSFYQYNNTIAKDTFVNSRTNGGFAPADPTGRGWFDTIDRVNKMIFAIDISSSPLTDMQIAQISAKIDSSYYTHEGGHGIGLLSANVIAVKDVEICDCTGDGIFTGTDVYYDDPSLYTQEEMGQNQYIQSCHIHHCRRQGISICGTNDVYVFNNKIHHIGYADDGVTSDFRNGTAPMFGIDVESMVGESNIPYTSIYLNQTGLETNYRIYIYNNYIHHNAKGHFVNADGTHITLQNNTFEAYNTGGVSSYPTQWFIKYLNNTFLGCQLVVSGNNIVNGAVMNKSTLNLQNVQGAFIENCQITDGLFNGSSIYGYLGIPAAVDVASGTFTYKASHGMGNGAQISFEQWYGKVPTGISVDKLYYTVNVTSNSFQVAEAKDGKAVIITDAGATGFNISRYDYGRCYIANITMEKSWRANNDYDNSTGFNPLLAGAVIKNVVVKNCSASIRPPDNYVGRPNVVEGFTLLEGTISVEGSQVSLLKVLRIKTAALGGDVSIGSTSIYSRVNIDSAFFQGVQVNIGSAYLSNGTFTKATLYKPDNSSISIITDSYLENSTISMHFISDNKSVTVTKCLFNQVAIDVSPAVRMLDNFDLNTGLSDNRMSALPGSGTFARGYIVYDTAPVPGGYVGWICTTAGIANNLTWNPSKAYTQGSQINYGGHVYQAISSGQTGAAIPSFNTNAGSSYSDGSVTWKEIGLLAVFKKFGAILS